MRLSLFFIQSLAVVFALTHDAKAAVLTTAGQPAELDVRVAGARALRITLKPLSYTKDFPEGPLLPERAYPEPVLRLKEITAPVQASAGDLKIEVSSEPLTLRVRRPQGDLIQELVFDPDGNVRFHLDDQPVLGLGEGGPLPPKDRDWKKEPVEFDRRGRLETMEPRWQSDAYGSRNPVPLLVGTGGWGLFFSSPWGRIDLSKPEQGSFLPIAKQDPAKMRQNFGDQGKQLGKGIPPMDSMVPGLVDLFVFDAKEPAAFMKDVAEISGPAVMPPKWALGYMQSHRTLEDDKQMLGIVDSFREKKIPLDAVIYLGTGFTPRGWNKPQPSFEFNPEVMKRDPAEFIADVHARHAKVVLHMVPWDRNKLPTLQGNIPPQEGEARGPSHLLDYWQQHEPLVKMGVDAWWPDEGDWFDLHERVKRHQLYYQGPLSTTPDQRPWSLHRNGYLGIARWGGWVWSGDTQSTWKTLEAQIAVGLNHSLSLSPYWGSDIAGFLSTTELTGELYARWFQFAAFCPSFRAHGRTWWTRLPWGWGLDHHGPIEDKTPPELSALNNPAIEPIAKRYAELRYQLLSYNYTLAWEARDKGLPFMRALWLHYPEDQKARGIGNEYLWGRDLLVAPVFEKGATAREVYLPAGTWYDWWTGERREGGATITRQVDLATMPIFVRAGAIVPVDPIRQYTAEKVDEPLTLRIYEGADGSARIYEDDGDSLGYLKGDAALAGIRWDDKARKLTIQPEDAGRYGRKVGEKTIRCELVPSGEGKSVSYSGELVEVGF
ncbi:TIM-barrel domain-containing protein [Haloferula sp. BvORR071]|uniref:TIM-barrel domain-containing protein n=1 Tax=Haloferula sp. BvORR071 TaxID=1396141 RepID=UPI000698825B|nr:TIM-barrel domain-containing protein [Haloferula sp. BvORR071]